jgi:hypothetical protein
MGKSAFVDGLTRPPRSQVGQIPHGSGQKYVVTEQKLRPQTL